MEHIAELVRGRRSVRTFDGKGLRESDLEKLSSFMAGLKNPYGIPVECKLLDAKQRALKCPVVSGTELYIGAKVKRAPHIEEAFGYSFELLVLYAQSLGIGTVWVGGTMDRAAFERAMELKEGEIMPCMCPLGYPAKKMSIKEGMMRKGIKADSRKPFETMFFDGAFDVPCGKLLRFPEADLIVSIRTPVECAFFCPLYKPERRNGLLPVSAALRYFIKVFFKNEHKQIFS